MSEKTYAMSETGVYVFNVDKKHNKLEIAETVESTYDVTVERVRTVITKGKTKRMYKNRRYETGKRVDVKKAYVTLKEGDSIPIFAATEEAEEQEAKVTEKMAKTAEKQAKKDAKKSKKESK